MKDLKEITILIDNYSNDKIKRKDLIELGLTDYFINKLVEENVLTKEGRGNYRINKKKSSTSAYYHYVSFSAYVRSGKYAEAYDELIKSCLMHVNRSYDNHSITYLLLLKEILGPSYDYSMLDELEEQEEIVHNNYYDDFINFRKCVKEKDFESASIFLNRFRESEYENTNANAISTRTFIKLINEVIGKDQQLIECKQDTEQANNYNDYCRLIRKDNFNVALEKLTPSMQDISDVFLLNNCKIQKELLEVTIDIINKQKVIKEKEYDYSSITNPYIVITKAIKNKDIHTVLDTANELYKEMQSKFLGNIIFLASRCIFYSNLNEKGGNRYKLRQDSNYHYGKHIEAIKSGKYEEALAELKIADELNPYPEHKLNNARFMDMLKFLIRMRNEKIGFENMEIDYSHCSNDVSTFNQAIDFKDYYTAFKLIGKITVNSQSKSLEHFKVLLHLMYEEDKKYNKNSKKVEIKEVKTKKFTDEDVYKMVVDKKYDELFDILIKYKKKSNEMTRMQLFTLKLLYTYLSLKKGEEIAPLKKYASAETDRLRRMFEAIKLQDLKELKRTIKLNYNTFNDKLELETYELLCDHLLEMQEVNDKKDLVKNEIDHYNNRLQELIFNKTNLSNDQIDEIYDVLEFLVEYEPREALVIIYHIVSMIDLVNNNPVLDESYFDTEEKDEKDVNKRLMYYLENGYYNKALSIFKYENINNLLLSYDLKDKYHIKRLIYIFNRAINKNNINANEIIIDELDFSGIDELKELKKMIKKREFKLAYEYCLNNEALKEYCSDVGLLYSLELLDYEGTKTKRKGI